MLSFFDNCDYPHDENKEGGETLKSHFQKTLRYTVLAKMPMQQKKPGSFCCYNREIFKGVFMKRSALIHPFLFTLVSLLFLYIQTSITIIPSEMLRPLLWLWLLLILLIYPAYKITKNWNWTGISLTLFVFAFFYEKNIFIAVFSVATIIILIWYFFLKKIYHRKMIVSETTFLLNLLSFALVLGGGIKLALFCTQIPNSFYSDFLLTKKRTPIAEATSREENPDIYFIILDGYVHSSLLEELYDFDNSAFTSYLEKKGFVVPAETHSNYPKTNLSIASILNMDYLQNITPGLEDNHFWWLMSPLINYSQTRLILENIGYKSVSLSANWTIANNKTTYIYYSPSTIQSSVFENYILHNTALIMIRPLVDKIAYNPFSYASHREMILYNFKTLSEINQLSGAHFTYVHFISPHPPFVFDKDGNEITPSHIFSLDDGDIFESEEAFIKYYGTGYRGQVSFLNQKLVQVIDDILENAETPPIIILQADHGSDMLVDFSSSENSCLHERLSPFAAYYLPGIDKTAIPSDITPVNLFRIIFNEYFETNLPLLENSYYFTKDEVYTYQLEEISIQRINAPCKPQP